MKLVDLNLLIYATNGDSPNHAGAHRWLQDALRGDETVALAWVVLLGFVRLSTRPGAFTTPLTMEQAFGLVEGWLTRPCVCVLMPGEQHWSLLRELLEHTGTAGNLTTDAHLAALAIEYGASLYSSDNDFVRFGPRLQFVNPLQA